MKKLCFGSLATVLVKCKAQATKQKNLIGTMLLSVNERYDIGGDDGAISALVTGRKNLSDYVTLRLSDINPQELSAKFRDNVLKLLDHNKFSHIILAVKAILAEDNDIAETTPVELVNNFTKAEILTRDVFVMSDFLAGLFLYTAQYTKNDKHESNVREISDNFIKSFDVRRDEILFVQSYGLKNLEVLSEVTSDADAFNLLTLENGQCPCCAKPLKVEQTILVKLEPGDSLLFCAGCAVNIQNSPEKKAEYLAVKKRLQANAEAADAISSNVTSDDVREIIEMISSGEPITESALRMSPLKIDEKISDRNLLRKVKAFVVDGMYEMVNEIINHLASANKLNVHRFARSIKRMYEDAADSLDSQSEIFNQLVGYLYIKSGQKNYEACEILISYFIQSCEVFNEIAK
jgi:hypothetical protein